MYLPNYVLFLFSTNILLLIAEDQFAMVLKLARVIPIFKAALREIIKNYRSISTQVVLSKILEKLLYKRLNRYFGSRTVLIHFQYGFRENSNTEHAILQFKDLPMILYIIQNVRFAVYIDLSKAFHTVNHNIMLRKLQRIGLRGIEFLSVLRPISPTVISTLWLMARFRHRELLIQVFLRDRI